jgi:hypothetical protein
MKYVLQQMQKSINPMEPEITEASSVKISPNKFSVIKTS